MKRPRTASKLLTTTEGSVLDLVDHVLNKGVMIQGDVVLGLANIDLIYLRLTALLSAADRLTRMARRRRR
jgi:hypothetical protein